MFHNQIIIAFSHHIKNISKFTLLFKKKSLYRAKWKTNNTTHKKTLQYYNKNKFKYIIIIKTIIIQVLRSAHTISLFS
jgi:hypothetical protein